MPSIEDKEDNIIPLYYSIVLVSYTAFQVIRKTKIVNKIDMVEAVGVEPTSETTASRELSCFFRVHFLSRLRNLERTKMRRRPV